MAVCLFTPPLLLSSAAVTAEAPEGVHIVLYQDGVATGPDGSLFMIPADSEAPYLEGSRVLDPAALDPIATPDAPELHQIRGPRSAGTALLDPLVAQRGATEARDWLASGTVPGREGPFEELAESALLDLRALTRDGSVLAAPSRQWRYVWPRDASFVAAAFARTGHQDEALDILRFLQDVQADDGSFQARYLPDGSGVPDARGVQEDGLGWALWAVTVLLAEVDPADRPDVLAELGPLVERSTGRILDLTEDGTRLPPPSSDYWEVEASTLTLGVAAPLLAGLEASARIDAIRGADLPSGAWTGSPAERAAARLRSLVEREFGEDGYARSITGGDRDAAVAFALPPYQPTPLAGAADAWTATVRPLLRPAGGISPGEGWRSDGVSWTPQTALYAFAAACAGTEKTRDEAMSWIAWLESHRTGSGALPEKVLADGSPAAVAPLAWTSALVVLTLVELDDSP